MKTILYLSIVFYSNFFMPFRGKTLIWTTKSEIKGSLGIVNIEIQNISRHDVIIPFSNWYYFDLEKQQLPYQFSDFTSFLLVGESKYKTFSHCFKNPATVAFCLLKPKEKVSFELELPKKLLENNTSSEILLSYIKLKKIPAAERDSINYVNSNSFVFSTWLSSLQQCGTSLYSRGHEGKISFYKHEGEISKKTTNTYKLRKFPFKRFSIPVELSL